MNEVYITRLLAKELDQMRKDINEIQSRTDLALKKIARLYENITVTTLDNGNVQRMGKNEKIKTLFSLRILTEESWGYFKILFMDIYPEYYLFMQTNLSILSDGEMRIVMLMKLNYCNKDIGNCLGITKESARVAIYRIRKKLNINTTDDLNKLLLLG